MSTSINFSKLKIYSGGENLASYYQTPYFSEDNKYVFVLSSRKALDFETKDYYDVHVLNTSDAKEINHHKFNYGYINGVRFKGDVAYLLFNEIKNNKYITHTISYSYKEDKVNWETVYHDTWGTFITRSYPEGTNHVVVTTYDTVNLLDGSTGKQLQTYHPKSEVIGIYSNYNSEYYLSFIAGGTVHFIDPSRNNSVEYGGRFILNLPEYSMVSMTPKGYLLVPLNGNRIILYEQKKNDKVEKLDSKPETNNNTDNPIIEYDNLKEEYKVNNKSLVKHMIYDDNREHLFVYYVNHEVAIYDTNSKKLINTVKDIISVDTYFGKDKYGRTYVGNLTEAYILDKDYNKVGHIKSLTKLDSDRVIVNDGHDYYSIIIYTLDDLLKEAKDYLNSKK